MWAWTFNPVNADLPRLFAFQSEAHRLQCIAAPPWKPPTQGLHHHAVAEGEVVFSLSLLTFNVLTLLDRRPAGERPPLPGVDSVSDGNVGMRLQGRKDALTTMLHEHGPNIVGLQETRLPDTAIQPDSEYHIYTSQANARGGGGCALWLSKTRPYASRGATKLFFRPEHVTVLTCSPRHLTASVLTPELRIFVQVAHASSAFNATPAELKAFWRQREEELARRPEGSYPILLTDANARLGSTVSDNVGDHHAEEEGLSGEIFHSLLAHHELWTPSTFADCHQGPSGTWRAPHGFWHRIDYIAVPVTWKGFRIISEVVTSFDVLQLRDDHRPVKLQCAFTKKAPAHSYTTSCRRAVRPAKPETPEAKARVACLLSSIPWFGWHVDVDVHCEALAEAWSTAGQTLQDKSRTAPVRPYVTSLAMQIISFRKELQSYLRQEATERTRRLLQIVFVAFRLYYQHRYFEGDQRALADRWLTAIDYSEALALALYRWYGLRLREQIAAGKRTYFQSLVADASNHTLRRPKELYAAIRKAFPAAKAARRSSLMPLPMLLDAQGQPIATTEARQECWREHFSEQEAGVPVTDQQFVTHLRARHRPAQAVFSIDVLPTLAQTEQVILGLKNGKAAGADCLTAELLKLSVPDTARRLMPVMLKSVLALREPVAWRGGDLILLAKKAGKALDCTGFRSILIASVAGKTFHRCVRTQLVPLLQAAKPALMAGAVEGVGIEVPALAVKTFQLWQQHTRRPWAVIFVDLQSAYYRVLRQLIVRHNGTDEELLSLLRKLDLPDAAIQELRHKLSTLAELPNLRASDHLQAVVADLLTGTWFRLNGQALLTATARGTRPGDPLADVLFSLTLSAYLRAVAHQLKEQGLDPALDTPRSRPHWAQCTDTLDIGAPAWADDFALPQVGDDAAHLLERVVSSVRVLVTHARSLGMVLKFGVEKTAALVSSIVSRTDQACILAGKDGGYHVVVHDDIDGTAYELPILEAYKHLGGIVTSNCSPTPDLHFRFSRASGTVKPLSRKLFSAHSFDLSVRRTLLRALVMSRYMHTGAALILPSAIHQRLWDRHYIALWRHLCRRESASRQEHPYLVLKAAKASAPPLAIAKSRACFLQKLFQHGPGLLLTLLFDHWASHPGSSWLQQFVTDVETVQQYCPTVLHFFRKGAEVHDLLEIYAESANWWPRQVAKAENAFQSDLAKWHAADPTTGSAPTPGLALPDFQCWLCPSSFPLRKHLHAHLAKAHRVYSPSRHFTLTPACLACHKWYGSIKQSQQHLKCSPGCLSRVVHLMSPLSYEQILELEAPEKAAARKIQRGDWSHFSARAPPTKAPVTCGPRIPTADERLQGLQEDDITIKDLARLFRPDPTDVAWISGHVADASTEGPRVHTKRFWQCRPLSHQNS